MITKNGVDMTHLRTLPKHRSEATYAGQTRGGNTSKAVKHKQAATNRYNRAIRRSKRAVIASQLND